MRFNFDKQYLKLCKYIGATAITVYLAFRLIDSIPFIYDNILLFLGSLWDITFPILLGFIIAYLMYGPVHGIEKLLSKIKFMKKRQGLCRAVGIIISYIAVLGLLIGILCGLYFMIGGQISQNSTISNIMASITDYFSANTLSTETITHLIHKLNLPFGDLIADQLGTIANLLQQGFASILDNIAAFIFDLGSNLFSLVISITLSIYVVASHEFFLDIWDKLFFIVFRERKCGVVIRRSLHIINETFSKYIHGQLIEASIVAILSTTVLAALGFDYALVVGIICGVFNLIPYIGPFIGIAIAAILVLFSGELWLTVITIIGLFIVQQIDCNILCPKIVGDIVGLHPALVLIAVTIGGNWYGLLGMIIAVPITASIKTLVSDWYSHYIKAHYDEYKENSADEATGEAEADSSDS